MSFLAGAALMILGSVVFAFILGACLAAGKIAPEPPQDEVRELERMVGL